MSLYNLLNNITVLPEIGSFLITEPTLLLGAKNLDHEPIISVHASKELKVMPHLRATPIIIAIATYEYAFVVLHFFDDTFEIIDRPEPIERFEPISSLTKDRSYLTFRFNQTGEIYTTNTAEKLCRRQKNIDAICKMLTENEPPIIQVWSYEVL